MANKVLKSIKFPGLNDTYTIPQVDNTLAVSGAAADAKKTGDAIGDLKSAVNSLADVTPLDIINGAVWAVGSINGTTGADAWADTRMRTGYIKIPEWATALNLSCDTGFKYFAAIINAEKTSVTKLENWYTKKSTIDLTDLSSGNRAYVRYVLQRTTNTIEDGDEVHAHMSTTPPMNGLINDVAVGSQYKFATLLMGYNCYIDYDKTNNTITIPQDSIYIDNNADGSASYHLLNASNPIVIDNVTVAAIGSSAVMLILDVSTWAFSVISYQTKLTENQRLVAVLRMKGGSHVGAFTTPLPWSIDGNPYGIVVPVVDKFAEKTGLIRSINHRGYNRVAPENTIPAFKLSRQYGFTYVETDIQFTSDGEAVCLHDSTINRTAKNSDGSDVTSTVNIYDITYNEALSYVFCGNKYANYPNVKLPKFSEFLKLCKDIGLRAYVELKGEEYYTQAQMNGLVDMVHKYGMTDYVTWISSSTVLIGYVKSADAHARLGVISGVSVSSTTIETVNSLKTNDNEVFLDIDNTVLTSEGITMCETNSIPLEVWTLNTDADITALDAYVTGVTSDNKVASDVLYNANIN